MEQLYLNGQEVDVTGENITFTLKSNLLGEFGKIVAGSSQTIRLPRTVRNMRILDFPEVVSRDGSMVRRKLSARLLRNGVPMIDDGEAVVLSTGEDGYEVGITYGVVSFLSAVKDGGSLNELPDEGESVEWNSNSLGLMPLTESPDYGFGAYDDGVNNTNVINVHPCVSIDWIRRKIESRFNFRFVGLNGLSGKYILLTEKKNSKEAIDAALGEYVTNKVERYSYGGANAPSYGLVKPTRVDVPNYNIEYKSDGRIIINQPLERLRLTVSISGYDTGTTLYLVKNTQTPDYGGVVAQTLADSYGEYYIDVTLEGLKVGDKLKLMFGVLRDDTVTGGVQISAKYVWDEEQEPEDITYPGNYPIVPNLPSMKMSDFIQLCGVLTGTFPMVQHGETGVLRMVRVEDLVNNKAHAADWSDKWGGEPDSVGYTYLGGQKNFIRWESDEAVEKSGVPVDGAVVVDDETLEVWNDLIKLPLSASNGGKMEQYSVVDGKLEDNGISERILVLNNETNEVAYTEELWPSTLRDTVLAGYRDLVRKPIVIRGTFQLSELDIRGLDYMRPVYLRQMGRYYGIVQVQYKGDESVVELLQLP